MTRYMVRIAAIGLLISMVDLVAPIVRAQQVDAATDHAVAPLFADHRPIQVTIEAPLTTLKRERPDEDYLDGRFTFRADDGAERTVDLKIQARGKFRRKKETCSFPPIRLNFPRSQLAGSPFAGQDKLKLVTHCFDSQPRYEQLVLREYLAYRIFQVMTDKSYGVRLLRVNYVDTEGSAAVTKFAFVIERDDDVAKRVGMKLVAARQTTDEHLEARQQNLVNVFEYLIGNTDFSLTAPGLDLQCCHNTTIMSATGDPPFTSVPYDFDFSGLVDAPYAVPREGLRIRNVRTRIYLGSCRNNGILPDTIQMYLDRKDDIYAILDELDMATPDSKRSIGKYLDSFFSRISTPKGVDSWLAGRCRKNS